jgi:hypothetical protein
MTYWCATLRDLMIPTATMQDPSSENHAAEAWLTGIMDPAQRQEFEAHLPRPPPATKVEPEPSAPAAKARAWQLLLAALVTLILGFALGWSLWQMAHR